MPLIHYGQYLTYADGTPAADITVPVRLLGGNVLVPLFSNKAGTTPLANPVMTDVDGLATFFAAPGEYFTDISGNVFHYDVDPGEPDEAWPGTYVHDQGVAASVWTVDHHFGAPPAVTVLVAGQVAEADVLHPDSETTTITFGAPTVGVALLRR
ncbi:hypothetical protein [Streptomyces wedmorensis]